MQIYVVGSTNTKFPQLDKIRKTFLTDIKHAEANIDFLNPWYCEITGLYHLIYNSTDSIIGLEQYRRYFLSSDGQSRLTENEINDKLKDFDIICAKEHYPNGNGPCIYCWPINTGKKAKFEIFLSILENRDKKMADYFRNYLQGQWHIQGNLVIGKRKILEDYLYWLLDILVEYNKIVKLTLDNKRINAYISEFFLGTWLSYYGYKLYFAKYMNAGKIID